MSFEVILPFLRPIAHLILDPAITEVMVNGSGRIFVERDGQLEAVETANWYPKLRRKDFAIGYTPSEGGLDDPDQKLYEVYACGAERNYTGYCDAEVDKLIEQQSMQSDPEKRRKLVWEIDRTLAEDGARPILFYARGATCWQPQVKGLTMMVNSISNGWRMEDVWLDK